MLLSNRQTHDYRTMNETFQKGEQRYEVLKPELEPAQNGKYIAIDTDSLEYFVANSREEAVDGINKMHPGKIPYSRKIGMVETVSRLSPQIENNNGRILRLCW